MPSLFILNFFSKKARPPSKRCSLPQRQQMRLLRSCGSPAQPKNALFSSAILLHSKQHGLQTQINSIYSVYIIITINQSMTVRPKNQDNKRKYAKISLKKRENLVHLVVDQGLSLTKMAKKLNLKLSTAKLIVRKYKQTGKYHLRPFKKFQTEGGTLAQVKAEHDSNQSSQQSAEKQATGQMDALKIETVAYPAIYHQYSYPYFGMYGVWPIDNYYQLI